MAAKRTFDSVSQETISQLINNRLSTNTKRNYKYALGTFTQFLQTIGETTSLQNLTSAQLDNILCQFWPSIKKIDGSIFKKNTLMNIRYGIINQLQEQGKGDLSTEDFKKSNAVYNSILKFLKQEGKGNTIHFSHIENSDLIKIVNNLSVNDPLQLQYLTWFLLQIHFCRRGRENLTMMKKKHFQL